MRLIDGADHVQGQMLFCRAHHEGRDALFLQLVEIGEKLLEGLRQRYSCIGEDLLL